MQTEREQWFETFLAYLKAEGWGAVFNLQGWDLNPARAQDVLEVDRNQPGFEDFSLAGKQAITPGDPACSLLYHALMSVGVAPDLPDSAWPSLEQIDRLENYIFGLRPLPQAQTRNLTPVVMAYEYRPASATPHHKHADLCFSRTAVGRVGSKPHAWDPRRRCFDSEDPDNPGQNRVLASRFGVFLCEAVPLGDSIALRGNVHVDDPKRQFWLPRQKLFAGEDAVQDVALGLTFHERHVSEKLQRMITQGKLPLGSTSYDTSKPPFYYDSQRETGDQAFIHQQDLEGSVVLARKPQELVRPAEQDGKPVSFRVPPANKRCFVLPESICQRRNGRRYTSLWVGQNLLLSSLDIGLNILLGRLGIQRRVFLSPRHAGEYTNIRHLLHEDGRVEDLNTRLEGFDETLRKGGYQALMFEDPICEGVVHASLQGIEGMQPVLPAYSLFTAPDFMPRVDGIDLYDYQNLFTEGGPRALCEGRLPPNLRLRMPGSEQAAFQADEENAMAMVSLPARDMSKPVQPEYPRSRYLPDAASDVFAPGWDVTYDRDSLFKPPYYHTAGLGSPFHEDVKLCAAANGMWPAASPDAARTFRRDTRTAIPLSDQELGLAKNCALVQRRIVPSKPGWDGEFGPYMEERNGVYGINFPTIERADYISNSFAHQMSFAALRKLSKEEIRNRMDALRKCRDIQEEKVAKASWLFLFQPISQWDQPRQIINLPDSFPQWDKLEASLDAEAKAGHLFGFATYGDNKADTIPDTPDRLFQHCTSFTFFQVPINQPAKFIPV